jgi:uncharacterized protein HemY
MERNVFNHPRRVLAFWAALLVIAVGLLGLTDYGMRSWSAAQKATDYRYYLTKAGAALEAGNYSLAQQYLSQAVSQAGYIPEVYVMMGHLHFRMKNWPRAFEAYMHAIEKGDDDVGIRQNAVWALIEQEKYEEAVVLGKRFIEEGKVGSLLHRYIGEACFRLQRYADSIPYFEHALEQQPNDPYLLARLSRALEATGETARAQEYSRMLSETHSGAL